MNPDDGKLPLQQPSVLAHVRHSIVGGTGRPWRTGIAFLHPIALPVAQSLNCCVFSLEAHGALMR